MNFVRTQPDAVWKLGYFVTGADLIDLDEKTKKAVNGSEGGLWLPSSPITIEGAGVGAFGPWDLSGGSANATGQITFDEGSADDYFRLDVGHSGHFATSPQQNLEFYSDPPEVARASAISPPGIFTQTLGARICFPLRCMSGGRITSVNFTVSLGLHLSLPAIPVRYAVFAVDVSGNRFPLRVLDATTDSDGFILDPSTTVGTYTTSGRVVAYVCNQNNIVDRSRFSYFCEVIHESGAGASSSNPAVFSTVQAIQDQIAIFDGRA